MEPLLKITPKHCVNPNRPVCAAAVAAYLFLDGCGIKKKARSHLSTADGVVGKPKCFVVPDHPVRSIKGGFAASFLMSRPTLLYQEGSCQPRFLSATRPESPRLRKCP